MTTTTFRTCTICEAMCGLKIETEGNQILSVLPDEDDVFSKGFICPKGAAVGEIHSDPDRLKGPMRRTPSGDFEPISWGDAFDLVGTKLNEIRKQHGSDSIAMYIGNPVIHNTGALALRSALIRAIGSKNVTSASSQDTSPRFATSYYLYGQSINVPVPDIDRTDYLFCLGANPRVSNGSLMTAPDVRRRLRAILERGGKVVVVDPRRTETAREASEYVSIRPGGDAALLLAMVQTLVSENRADASAIARVASDWDDIVQRLHHFQPERVERHTGVDAATIRRLAREFVAAKSSVAYSRVGVCNNQYGTVASYATDLLNLVAGRLGAIGGSMFPTPLMDATPIVQWTKADGHARWRTRVRGLPETLGDVPASTLAEEMETPGPGQVRAFLTFAGNPVLSTPNGRRLAQALPQLEFMVSIDPYLNETTRHAHVILPGASGLTEEHVDIFLPRFAVRNVARYSPAVVKKNPNERFDWEVLLEIIDRLGGGPTGMTVPDKFYRFARRLGLRWSPKSTIDLLIRIGRYGDRFLPWSKGLNLKKLMQHPHGVDLGPLEPGLDRAILHKDRKVHLRAEPILTAVDALAVDAAQVHSDDDSLLLIGRRELRSNNSWLHNTPSLVRGKERCVLYVHPDDAARLELKENGSAILESRMYQAPVPICITDEIRPGVVSLPHGWGHSESAPWQRVAGERPGISMNNWTDENCVESVVGQSILNGLPVKLRPVRLSCDPTGTDAVAESTILSETASANFRSV